MALPTLNWKYVGRFVIGANVINTILDALYTAGTSATYYDGSARTPGSGSAWTWVRYQNAGTTEAAYGTPPAAAVSGLRVIYAGQAAIGKVPTMAAPDANTAALPMVAINKGSGAFTAWENAAPFTSGSFSGYWHAGRGTGSITYSAVHYYECEEAIFVAFESSTQTICASIAGCYIDPQSTDVLDAETDGRIYGWATSGSAAVLSTTTFSSGTNGASAFLRGHSTSANQPHSATFTVGAGTLVTATDGRGATANLGTTWNAAQGKLPSGKIQPVGGITLMNVSTQVNIGVLRDIWVVPRGRTGTKVQNGGVDWYYPVSGSTSTDSDAFGLVA